MASTYNTKFHTYFSYLTRIYRYTRNLTVDNYLEIINTAAMPPRNFGAFKYFCTKNVHKHFHSLKMMSLSLLLKMNQGRYFVNNDMFNIFLVNFDNLCRNILKTEPIWLSC